MRKLASVIILLAMICSILAAAPCAKADTYQKVKAAVINTIKTRGQTSTPTPTATTAVRG